MQSGAPDEIEAMPEMIAAGVRAYDEWEPDHIFAENGGAAAYAVRKLVVEVFKSMRRAEAL